MSFLIHVASNKDNNLYYLHYAEGLDTWCMYNQDLAAPLLNRPIATNTNSYET